MQIKINVDVNNAIKALRVCGAIPYKEISEDELKTALLKFLGHYGISEVSNKKET